MSNNFLKMMGNFQAFMGRPRCRVCESRACVRPGYCDDHALLDRAILTCANVSNHVTMEECRDSKSFAELSDGQVFLVYKAGELLAGKR